MRWWKSGDLKKTEFSELYDLVKLDKKIEKAKKKAEGRGGYLWT